MQVNSVNNQNFGALIIPSKMKSLVEKDMLRILSSSPDKVAQVAAKISHINRGDSGLNIRVSEAGEVFIENLITNRLTKVEKDTIGQKVISAVNSAFKMVQGR